MYMLDLSAHPKCSPAALPQGSFDCSGARLTSRGPHSALQRLRAAGACLRSSELFSAARGRSCVFFLQ